MKKRVRVSRKTRPAVAVVVDGDCELWYLQMLKRHERSVTVNIEPRLKQKKTLKEQYDSIQGLAEIYYKVFWIVDLDVLLKEAREAPKGSITTLNRFGGYKKNLIQKHKNVVVIVNNPCIEFWLLLHFQFTKKAFANCGAVEGELKRHLSDYEKTQKYYTKEPNDIYARLRSKLSVALKHAKKIGAFDSDNADACISEMQLFFHAQEFGDCFLPAN